MKYVYILQSISDPERFYVGISDDVKTRLAVHNSGHVPHTSKFGPWRIKTFIGFADDKQAFAFEKYLNSASGRAFAKKRLQGAVHAPARRRPKATSRRVGL